MATMQENDTGPSPDDEKAAVSLTSADDTTSASSGVAANADFEEEDEDENPMPLLNYSRLSSSSSSSSSPGSTSSRKHTCSTMARVWLDPMEDTESTAATITPSNPTTTADGEQQQENNPQLLLKSDLWKQQPHWIMAVGMSDGSVSLISVDGGTEVLSAPQSLTVAEGDREENPVIDVSLDSSGKVLAAIDASGTCAIWELQYSVKYHTAEQELVEEQPTRRRSSTTSTTAPHSQEGNMFSSFMSALTGVPPSPPPPSAETSNSNNINNNNSNENTTTSTRTTTMLVPKLTATIIQTSRITYPQNWSTPSCLALDPAHKRKREKSLLVGFEDGRLLLTKRGGLFQRRNDTVLYQGSPGGENSNSSSESYRGIQAVAWRGNLVAWADVTGMKLLEVETLTRVAHIDRPTGARPTLYPTISNFRPHLHFEQSTKLLVAWGDCLMEMNIETVVDATNADAKRKTVECIMAWELDCVACGVSPLDENHVVVLGLVPPEDDDENGEKTNDENDLEVQIVRRQDGTVRYCDSLPLAGSSAKGSPYTLLSSFALPRMEDAFELEEFLKHGGMDQQPDLADMGSLFATGEGSRNKTPKFRDCHLDWNVENILFEEEEEEEDMNSVDSDDYEFVLRPIIDVSSDQEDRTRPPLLVVACASDLVLARVSSVDDAVAHALSQNKCALALSRGLRHRRQLRRFDLSNLVNHYLEAVLQLSPAEEADEGEEGSPLSLRRMQLAVQAMPVLLGGRIDLWKRWAAELERIPGSLFLLRNYLPVRGTFFPFQSSSNMKVSLFSHAVCKPKNFLQTLYFPPICMSACLRKCFWKLSNSVLQKGTRLVKLIQ